MSYLNGDEILAAALKEVEELLARAQAEASAKPIKPQRGAVKTFPAPKGVAG